jgi:ATP-dependent Zn protease
MDQLATLAAGLEAERAFNCPLHEHAGDRDRLMAITLIREHYEDLTSEEIQSHMAAGHARARELLLEHRDRVIRIAERLLDVRQVDDAEFLILVSI